MRDMDIDAVPGDIINVSGQHQQVSQWTITERYRLIRHLIHAFPISIGRKEVAFISLQRNLYILGCGWEGRGCYVTVAVIVALAVGGIVVLVVHMLLVYHAM